MPESLRNKPELTKDLGFGTYPTDLMLEIDWSLENGWEKPQIGPFRRIQISPFCGALNYAVSCIESKSY